MSSFRVGCIGTGGRSVIYAKHFAQADDVEVVAVADPSPGHRKLMRVKAGLPNQPDEYDDWRDMLASRNDLDGVVVCTPNHLHADQVIAALERGLPVAAEKPLASTKADCERILAAQRATGGRVVVGFVLRSTPFYRKIYDLVRSGRIGKVTSVQADELVGWLVSSIMNRNRWRRWQATGGGTMLEKACHDMDVLNWLVGSRPVSLNSYGGRQIFVPNPALPERCEGCGVADRCKYYKRPPSADGNDEAVMHDFIREEDACVYNIDKDIYDVQSVNIEYANGVVANFMLNLNCSGRRAGRNLHVIGLNGRIWGNFEDGKVHLFDNLTEEVTTFTCESDGSGHGGGDRTHVLELQRMMADKSYRPRQDVQAGYLSAVMSLASDVSARERRRVEFTYDEDRTIHW